MRWKSVLVAALLLLIVSVAVARVTYRIDRANCTGCGDCDRVCPVDAISIVDGKSYIDTGKCIGCGLCLGVCTFDAVR